MPITVFDAVGKFTADTTNLDAFTVKLERGLTSASEKAATATVAHAQALAEFRLAIKAASSATDDGGAAIQRLADAEKQLQVSAAAASQSQRQLKSDLGLATQSTREARGEAMLLGEAFGVHLPREVNTFLARLPGIGQALNTAFAATAIFFLADALVGGAEKLSKFIADTFIFTQAMKDSDIAIGDMNKKLLASADASAKAEESLRKFGASGTDATRLQIADNEKAIAQQQQIIQQERAKETSGSATVIQYRAQTTWLGRAYDSVSAIVKGTKDQHEILTANVDAARNAQLVADAQSKALEEQNKLLQEQLETQSKLDAIDQGKSLSGASLNLQKAQALATVAFDQDVANKRILIEQQFEAKTYLMERNALEQKLGILKEHDANTKDQQAKVNNELIALQNNYDAKVVERATKLKDDLVAIEKAIINTSGTEKKQSFAASILGDYQDDFAKAEQAASELGVTLGGTLTQNIDKAKAAYAQLVVLEKEGKITALDLKNARIQELEAEIAYAKATGVSAQQIQNLVNEENRLKGTIDNSAVKIHHLSDLIVKFSKDTGGAKEATATLKTIGVDAFNQFGAAVENAMSQAILAQANFGVAMEKALASALASIAAQAIVQALYYTAEGFAALAHYDSASAANYFTAAAEMGIVGAVAGIAGHAIAGASSGGGGGSSSPAGTSSINTSPAENSGPQPVQTVNVQRAGAGALVSSPTLMLVGDSRASANMGAREAVIPLDDPQAQKQLGSVGGETHIHVHLGSGMMAGTPDQLGRMVVKHANRVTKSGKAMLHSSSTGRVIKKSP